MAAKRQRKSSAEKRQYWQAHSDGYAKSGQTRTAYCKQNNLNLQTFAYWRRRLKTESGPVKLVQLPATIMQASGSLRVEVNGYNIEVSEGFSSGTLARLVRVLREL
jgi:hypothetical protein